MTQLVLVDEVAGVEETYSTLQKVLPDLPWGHIASIFERMEIAEDEIEQGQARHPEQAALIYDAFQYLSPTRILAGYADNEALYRSHCREIIERVAAEEDVKLATDAELLAGFAEVSQRAPLSDLGHLLYFRLFTAVFGEERARACGLYEADLEYLERHYGARADAELTRLRTRSSPEHRSVKEK